MARPKTCACGVCAICLRREKAAADRRLLNTAKKLELVPEPAPPGPAEAAAPAPPSPAPPALPSPSGGDGPDGEARGFGTAPPPPRLRLAPPPSSAPRPDPSSWQDAALDLEAEPQGPERSPDEAAADRETEIARRMKSLTPVGLLIAEGLAGNVERNRLMCEQLGMPWPRLSSAAEDAQFLEAFREMYLEACKYTVAMFLPTRQGKYTPVVVCLGGQVGSVLAVQLAARRANGTPAAHEPNPRAQADAEADLVPQPGSPQWRSPLDLAGVPRGGEDE